MYAFFFIVSLLQTALARHISSEKSFQMQQGTGPQFKSRDINEDTSYIDGELRSRHYEPHVNNNNDHAIQKRDRFLTRPAIINSQSDNYENTSENNFGYHPTKLDNQRTEDTVTTYREYKLKSDNSKDFNQLVTTDLNIDSHFVDSQPLNVNYPDVRSSSNILIIMVKEEDISKPNRSDNEAVPLIEKKIVLSCNSTTESTTTSPDETGFGVLSAVFIGDACPSGQAKVSGKCIDLYDF